jgi:Flp pilus assembly pilin Flp
VLSVFAGSAILGIVVSALLLVAYRQGNQILEVLIGAVGLIAAATVAALDPIDLGGSVLWRFASCGAALAGAIFASRSVIRRHAASGVRRRVVSLIALGSAVFSATGTVLLGVLVGLSLMLS